MQPGSPEWSAALDRHLSPPDYDGCEDCDCESPQDPSTVCPVCADPGDSHLTEPGETCIDREQIPCPCKCHDHAYDPREDGDEPDDIPDYWDAPDYNEAEQEEHHG